MEIMRFSNIVKLLIVPILLLIVSCSSKDNNSLTIFTAASTVDIIEEVANLYQEQSGVSVKINTASSGILAKQIKNGAECDIYISASKRWIDYLDDFTIETDILLRNSLVIITPLKSKKDELNSDISLSRYFSGKFSIGDPNHVPAGLYAVEALKNSNWYKEIEDQILPAANVRAALSVIELGEIEAGIVYKTDALKSKKVNIVYTFPSETHSPIDYYCGVLNSNEKSEKFYDFLVGSTEAKGRYSYNGFILPEEAGNDE